MTLYVDTSLILQRYLDEPDSDAADRILMSDPLVCTARHTIVEVRRNLARILNGADATDACEQFRRDLLGWYVIELDATTCELAATIGEQHGVRTSDALHLGAAARLGLRVGFATADDRQAVAAEALGFQLVRVGS